MKIQLEEKTINSYDLTVTIEREGESYRALIHYDDYDGYEVTFLNDKGERVSYPKWAIDYEEENATGECLGYWLEESMEESK